MFKGLGSMGDMAKMMKAAQEMKTRMENLQEEMHRMTVTGESGAGLVKATCTAKGELKTLDIDPSIFAPTEKEVVEDLILAAIKDAQQKASDKAQEEMSKITQELGLPADMKLPF
ncbi:YbaB/EbfC family nucleoid-associated protein [Aquicoccus porphyridii]|uniref:Nucleoid-associated protein FLO80_05655 n=1 Tax=Aquicoccus porphyridii TaxID=1852029 RepID=A0A5A9ZK45_9RHOB|nr:YbaB/EbfC family nucleoid-associated protein [Aquicoccus porphyridii]KAA0917527.1 YbaB/EbfC family nucleoid-associated protein [Aquicoccus porphyridii]RAI55608.1 YbaB/EbfC family nucleoid-associated protein [Rhodobacteraceae bacterium AsT-22]